MRHTAQHVDRRQPLRQRHGPVVARDQNRGSEQRVEVHVATAVSSSSGASTLWYCGGIGAPARPPYPRVGDSGHMKWSCTQRLP